MLTFLTMNTTNPMGVENWKNKLSEQTLSKLKVTPHEIGELFQFSRQIHQCDVTKESIFNISKP